MDTGSTAWVLAATMGVLLMVPGLALFYGGMVGARSVLNVAMMTFGAVAVTAVVWTVYGYSVVFGSSYGGVGLLGDVGEYLGLSAMLAEDPKATLPAALVAVFQALFAALTVAIISGALVDRVRFGAWLVFSGAWVTLVYLPIAHWVFAFSAADGSHPGGWIVNRLQAVDYAGGTAVHINSGIAALAAILALGKRIGWPRQPRPNSIPLVVLGGGILWFGWFGFNGGSALAAGNAASVVVLTTFNAACTGLLAWLAVEKLVHKKATTLGAVSGTVAGLVAITPACGAVSPLGALAVGAVAGAISPLAINLKYRLGYDDALDVVGVHLVGGVVGTLLVGVFAAPAAPNARTGLLYGGGFGLLGAQAVAAGAVLGYSFVVTWLLVKLIDATMGMRLQPEAELEGVDLVVHGERAYDLDGHPHSPAPDLTTQIGEVVATAESISMVAGASTTATRAGGLDAAGGASSGAATPGGPA